jgi:hypothetical protein
MGGTVGGGGESSPRWQQQVESPFFLQQQRPEVAQHGCGFTLFWTGQLRVACADGKPPISDSAISMTSVVMSRSRLHSLSMASIRGQDI